MGNQLSPDNANKLLFGTGLSTFILSAVIVICTVINSSIRKKLFPRIVAWISFCEMMGSLAILFGVTKNDLVCTLQSGLFMFFERAGWNWTIVLAVQLDGLVTKKHIPFTEWQMHIFAWVLSLLFEVIPLFRDMKYGSDDDSTICSGLHYTRFVTEMIAIIFTGYLFLVILVLFYYNFKLFYFLKISGNEKLMNVAQVLRRYPLSLIIFWLPNMIISTLGNAGGPSGYQKLGLMPYLIYSLGLGILYGAAVAGLYIYSYSDALLIWFRRAWSGGGQQLASSCDSQDYPYGTSPVHPPAPIAGRDSAARSSSGNISTPTDSSRSNFDYIDDVDIVDYDRSRSNFLYGNSSNQEYNADQSLMSQRTNNTNYSEDSINTSLIKGESDPNSPYYIGRM